MARIPGTEGPVSVPYQPEGGVEGGPGYSPLPGGTNRTPELAPTSPGPQQGAGSGSGGLYPNPGESATGSIQKGYKGDGYANAAPPNVEAINGLDVANIETGKQGVAVQGLSVPTDFTDV